jgi:hypothetical protein
MYVEKIGQTVCCDSIIIHVINVQWELKREKKICICVYEVEVAEFGTKIYISK